LISSFAALAAQNSDPDGASILAGIFYVGVGALVFAVGPPFARAVTRMAHEVSPNRRRKYLPVFTRILAILIVIAGVAVLISGLLR
jgi:small neutral amino acid transporter SnatA (MarC family)